MHHDQSRYSRWSWIITLLLALILLWMFLTGKGPSNACCHTPVAEVPVLAEATQTEEPLAATEAFSFSTTSTEFVSHGDPRNIDWLNDLDALKALLEADFKVEGDSTSVLLTGPAASEEIKQQKGNEAQAFFGPGVTVDNQITVTVATPDVALPAAAKLYFNTGYHRLPADGQATLEPTIAWLNHNPDAKAIISGYHDQTGDLTSNQKLAKKRAKSAYDALLSAGIDAARIEMRKPISTKGNGDLSEARRVEVTVE